jgi:DNA processing protein
VADAPTVLFKQGNFSFHQNAGQVPVAIVGTRGPSDYGKKQARFFGKSLALAGLHIVSGLALGIDTEAHEGALEAGIPTTAVLGHGFGTIYPAVNKKLAARIRENGCLLTEQLHDVEPEAHSFPARNRIVAGICRATIVIESRIKGGALITAEYALSQHREVMVLPGNVNSEVSAGCHALIRKSSAGLVTCPQDVLEDLGLGANGTFFQTPSLFEEPAAWSSLTPTEEKILLALGNGEQHIDVLAHETGIPQADLLALLFTLEMAGWIQNLPGQRIKRLA